MVATSTTAKVHSSYRNAKPHHPPGGSPGGGFRHLTRLCLFIVTFAYIATLLYTRSLLHARDEATELSVSTLQHALNNLQEKYNEAITTQTTQNEEHDATLRLLDDKQAALTKAERRLDAWGKVEDRLSENTLIEALQKQNLLFDHLRWGAGPARVVMEMGEGEEAEEIELELAPFELMPHVTHWFLTLVETGFWDGCHIIRNAGHVLQLNCHARSPLTGNQALLARLPPPPNNHDPTSLPSHTGKIHGRASIVFQEFSSEFNHLPFTLGVAGRPGGEDFYINLMENSRSHGPGGQGPEADPCFAKIVRGKEVVEGYHDNLGEEFLEPSEYVLIKRAYIVGQE